MPEVEFEVGHTLAGERLDRALALVAAIERSVVVTAIAQGRVLVNGAPESKKARRLVAGDRVAASWDAPGAPPPPPVAPTIRWEDEDLVIVAKPAGLLTHRTHPRDERPSVADWARARFPELEQLAGDQLRRGIVHRLDLGTSGLVVLARSAVARERLEAMVAHHEMERRYLALVRGAAPSRARIDAPLGRDLRDPTRMSVVLAGKPAVTLLERCWAGPDTSLVELTLQTGRTHQIRVHLAAIGHGIVGDARYGVTLPELDRPFLHAWRLSLMHPRTGEYIEVQDPLPRELAALAERARSSPILRGA